MVIWDPERVIAFRKKLREEMMGAQLWYHPTKERNKDILIIHPECPYANKKGKVPEHRYIWWLHHKDEPIGYNEMIHHINGDHQDNRIENLQKVKMKQHQLEHLDMINQPQQKLTRFD